MAGSIRAVKASDTVYSINVVGTALEVRSGFSCVRDSISVGEAVVLKGGCLVLSCLVLAGLVLFCFVLSDLVLSSVVLSCFVLLCLALPCLVLLCLVLSDLVLSGVVWC